VGEGLGGDTAGHHVAFGSPRVRVGGEEDKHG